MTPHNREFVTIFPLKFSPGNPTTHTAYTQKWGKVMRSGLNIETLSITEDSAFGFSVSAELPPVLRHTEKEMAQPHLVLVQSG